MKKKIYILTSIIMMSFNFIMIGQDQLIISDDSLLFISLSVEPHLNDYSTLDVLIENRSTNSILIPKLNSSTLSKPSEDSLMGLLVYHYSSLSFEKNPNKEDFYLLQPNTGVRLNITQKKTFIKVKRILLDIFVLKIEYFDKKMLKILKKGFCLNKIQLPSSIYKMYFDKIPKSKKIVTNYSFDINLPHVERSMSNDNEQK